MKKQNSARNTILLYVLAAVYIAVFIALSYVLHISGLEQDKYALVYAVLQGLLCLPFGIIIPLIHSRARTGIGAVYYLIILLVILSGRLLTNGVELYTVLGVIGIIAGECLGYLVWKKWIDGRIDFSGADVD